MLKRKRDEDASGSIFNAPPLESTMLIDTGGIKTGDQPIGDLTSIPVSASLSSGVRLFVYNRFFWNRDLYTFNIDNCAIMLILSWYQGVTSKPQIQGNFYTMLFPIFLPQTTLSTYQNVSNDPTTDPKIKQRYIDDLLYYLNGMWVANQIAESGGDAYTIPPSTGPYTFGPHFFTYNAKGFLKNPTNHPDFPFFVKDTPPPLKWVSLNSNQNIALVRNPDYWNQNEGTPNCPKNKFDCAFQIVNPYEGWTNSPGNVFSNILAPDGGFLDKEFFGSIQGAYVNSGSAASKGWCGRGAFNIGFAQEDDQKNFGNFTDVYGFFDNPVLQSLWTQYAKSFPVTSNYSYIDGVAWNGFVNAHKLVHNNLVAFYIPNFLPTRFVVIESSTMSVNQKFQMISNSPHLSKPTAIGLEYVTLKNPKVWQDSTTSGTGLEDNPVLHMDPSWSMLALDITISDEFGAIIQNYKSSQGSFVLNFSPVYNNSGSFRGLGLDYTGNYVMNYISGENSFVLNNSGGQVAKLTSFYVPPWLAAMNPLNSVSLPPPSQQPLLGDFCTYNMASLYMLFAKNYSRPVNSGPDEFDNIIPSDFSANMPISSSIIHFGRLLGY